MSLTNTEAAIICTCVLLCIPVDSFAGIRDTGSLVGSKWEDLDGNGRRDRDEPGLAGVTVYLDRNGNGQLDKGELRTITVEDDPATQIDETGLYFFQNLASGRYVIREVVPDGFVQTFPVSGPSPAGGAGGDAIVLDPTAIEVSLAANDALNRTVSFTFTPLCIRPIELDLVAPAAPADMFENHTGVLLNACGGDTSSFSISLTGDGSAHEFDLVFIDAESGNTYGQIPVRINLDGAHTVDLKSGAVITDLDFGNRRRRPSSLCGTKWEDEDGDGQRDPNERGLAGVTVYLDRNSNGSLDVDEPRTVTADDDKKTAFDETGLYCFPDIDAGHYVIREVVPDGFVQTYPVSTPDPAGGAGETLAVSPTAINVSLADGEVLNESVSFTFFPLCVRPFNLDVVAPAAPTGMFTNLSGTRVNECGGDTSTFSISITGDGDSHQFDVEIVDAEFGGTIARIPVSIGTSGAHIVDLAEDQSINGLDFGNRRDRPSSLCGIKWEDRNGNGRREAGEPGLPGVTIYLDRNSNGTLDAGESRTITAEDDKRTAFDETGLYCFQDVDAGRHVVREVVPDGFVQTFPTLLLGGGAGDPNVVVNPTAIDASLEDGEVLRQSVSFSFLPLCFRPINLDVVAPSAPANMFQNTTGTRVHQCGGDTSSFATAITGDGSAHQFDIVFVDAEFHGMLARIPVTINGSRLSAPHRVAVRPGQTIDGLDFGNLRSGDGNHRIEHGDCDGDEFVGGSVADPVFYLNWAFGVGPEPECLAACDADGNGFVGGSVNDAVFYLNWAFSGGPPPGPPGCSPVTPADARIGCDRPPEHCASR